MFVFENMFVFISMWCAVLDDNAQHQLQARTARSVDVRQCVVFAKVFDNMFDYIDIYMYEGFQNYECFMLICMALFFYLYIFVYFVY